MFILRALSGEGQASGFPGGSPAFHPYLRGHEAERKQRTRRIQTQADQRWGSATCPTGVTPFSNAA